MTKKSSKRKTAPKSKAARSATAASARRSKPAAKASSAKVAAPRKAAARPIAAPATRAAAPKKPAAVKLPKAPAAPPKPKVAVEPSLVAKKSKAPSEPKRPAVPEPPPEPIKSTLARKDLEVYRRLLTDKQREFTEAYRTSKGDSRTDLSNGTEDYIDYAVSSYSKEFLLSLTEMDRRQLQLVQEALRRIDRSEYGMCLQCGREIPRKRLDVQPWARHCVACQELEEKGLLQPHPYPGEGGEFGEDVEAEDSDYEVRLPARAAVEDEEEEEEDEEEDDEEDVVLPPTVPPLPEDDEDAAEETEVDGAAEEE